MAAKKASKKATNKKIDKLNVYLSNLAVLNIKLHNLHWNVVGKNFVPLHNFTEEQYDAAFAKFDDVAEIIKQKGFSPLVKLADYIKTATLKEIDEKAFTDDEVLKIVEADYQALVKLVEEIRGIADDEEDYQVVAMMEDHAGEYIKTLWFLRQMRA